MILFGTTTKNNKTQHCQWKFEDGGLKMPDVEAKVKSLKPSWIQRMLDCSDYPWKAFLRQTCEEDTNMFVLFQRKLKHLPVSISIFYKQVLKYWD